MDLAVKKKRINYQLMRIKLQKKYMHSLQPVQSTLINNNNMVMSQMVWKVTKQARRKKEMKVMKMMNAMKILKEVKKKYPMLNHIIRTMSKKVLKGRMNLTNQKNQMNKKLKTINQWQIFVIS